MKLSTFRALLCVSSLLYAAHAHADTGCAYDPRTDGTWTKYQLYQIGGHWDPTTKQITVDWRTALYQQTFVWDVMPNMFGAVPIFGEMFFGPSKTVNASTIVGPAVNQPGFALYDIVQQIGNVGYIGEIGSPADGWTISPGEPKISMVPQGGEHYETDHWVQDSSNGSMVMYQMHTSFWAITGPGYVWTRIDGVQFRDCVWTSLEERPGDPGADYVYNYVFQRGVGILDIRWGNLRDHVNNVIDVADGQYTAYEYQAIAWGKLP